MNILYHKRIQNALIYTQLTDLKSDDYMRKVKKLSEEAAPLKEAGFEYVGTAPDDLMLFRKRK